MINQAVDVSSDFRACFTTSRSTSAQVCVSSRAISTEITMMNKSRAMRQFCETCADVACNPDGSCGAGSTEEILSQFSDTMQKHSDGNTATVERRSQIQEQQDSNNELCSSDINTDRLIHVEKEAVKNSASSCCQKILQRAIEAELQILNTHYQMCYQHCLKICKLALEENTFFISRQNVNTELDSSLMLVLEELKKKYISMRTKIKMGIPLDALPPLSVEMNLFPVSFSYVPSKTFKEQYKEENVEHEAKVMESGSACSFVRVGGLSSSVSEDDLRTHFQKYQISDTVISVNSSNCRHVFLSFKDTNKAKLAVEEMNQKKIKGKPLSVELDTGENLLQKTSLPLSTNSHDAFIPPNMLNLSNFTKLMKKLQKLHPEASRDRIVDALMEVRKNNNGILSGLSISSIVERTSAILRKSTPS
ncbi:RNA-binding protein 44 [Phaethornis superciliosus]